MHKLIPHLKMDVGCRQLTTKKTCTKHTSLREDSDSIKYRRKDQKARNEKRKEIDPLEVTSYKPWWLRTYSLLGTPQGASVQA